MTFKQHCSITTKLKSPFWLTKVPIALDRRCTRKRITCGYKAVAELRGLRLNPKDYYGADVTDSNGTIVAELE